MSSSSSMVIFFFSFSLSFSFCFYFLRSICLSDKQISLVLPIVPTRLPLIEFGCFRFWIMNEPQNPNDQQQQHTHVTCKTVSRSRSQLSNRFANTKLFFLCKNNTQNQTFTLLEKKKIEKNIIVQAIEKRYIYSSM